MFLLGRVVTIDMIMQWENMSVFRVLVVVAVVKLQPAYQVIDSAPVLGSQQPYCNISARFPTEKPQ